MPQFVVLRHETADADQQRSHWDIMFECNGALRTWSCEEWPEMGRAIGVRQKPDHRLAYLTYEGEVSGNRGRVRRVDCGQYTVDEDTEGRWVVRLAGEKLTGRLALTRSQPESLTWSCEFGDGTD